MFFFYYSHTTITELNEHSYELYLLCKNAPSTVLAASPKPIGYDSTDGDASAK
jgi:hypothetical protein